MKGLPFVKIAIFIIFLFAFEEIFKVLNIPAAKYIGIIIAIQILVFVLMKQELEKGEFLYSFLLIIAIMVLNILIFATMYREYGIIEAKDSPLIHDGVKTLYFSIVTWTTLGYGDYHPSESIRLHAALEALLGYIYLGIIIGFVSNWLFSKSKNPTLKG